MKASNKCIPCKGSDPNDNLPAMNLVMNRHRLLPGLIALVFVAPGCGPDIQTLCASQEKCLGGNAKDIDACVALYDGSRDKAYDIGCGEEYDALLACSIPNYECIGTMPCTMSSECAFGACVSGECKVYGIDSANADSCVAEQNADSSCK